MEKIEAVRLDVGKTVDIRFNKAVEIVIKTTGGTVIKGVIPANERFVVTNGGDIESFDVNIYDTKSGPQKID
ncbi:hypothetical protein ACSITO_000321 [Enterobacter hormaechei]|uniref:hypothetical protein n=1 Tax=Enterobacter TaxID=547 RepID=UPI000F842BCB|nr:MULTISPECIES: hypothetical protein [Enterobacter]CAE7100891.1 hypothetical protein AI2697V1_3144 [Enterobacter cloacae]EIY1343237.1 hypothetical protein [Enterobacter hormaechei]EIY1348118.1 hypothetical protein [Enterobacter hormaechei]EIY1362474.1 hypothetical protein [Enterobacter hormaechei]EKS6353404.1 hypothetical protein [Enterobacter hormaechei]